MENPPQSSALPRPPGPRAPGLSILASVQLPGIQLWIVGDDASTAQLARMLQGNHLILTLGQVQGIFQSSQRRVIVPELVGVKGN